MSRLKNKQGFTLIELVVVMAIIAVLAMLMVGAIIAARKQSVATQIMGDAKTYETALETYSSNAANLGKYPFAATSGAVSANLSAATPLLSTDYLSKTPTNTDVIFYFSGTQIATSGKTSSYTLVACPSTYTTTPLTSATVVANKVTVGRVPSGTVCSDGTNSAAALYSTAR